MADSDTAAMLQQLSQQLATLTETADNSARRIGELQRGQQQAQEAALENQKAWRKATKTLEQRLESFEERCDAQMGSLQTQVLEKVAAAAQGYERLSRKQEEAERAYLAQGGAASEERAALRAQLELQEARMLELASEAQQARAMHTQRMVGMTDDLRSQDMQREALANHVHDVGEDVARQLHEVRARVSSLEEAMGAPLPSPASAAPDGPAALSGTAPLARATAPLGYGMESNDVRRSRPVGVEARTPGAGHIHEAAFARGVHDTPPPPPPRLPQDAALPQHLAAERGRNGDRIDFAGANKDPAKEMPKTFVGKQKQSGGDSVYAAVRVAAMEQLAQMEVLRERLRDQYGPLSDQFILSKVRALYRGQAATWAKSLRRRQPEAMADWAQFVQAFKTEYLRDDHVSRQKARVRSLSMKGDRDLSNFLLEHEEEMRQLEDLEPGVDHSVDGKEWIWKGLTPAAQAELRRTCGIEDRVPYSAWMAELKSLQHHDPFGREQEGRGKLERPAARYRRYDPSPVLAKVEALAEEVDKLSAEDVDAPCSEEAALNAMSTTQIECGKCGHTWQGLLGQAQMCTKCGHRFYSSSRLKGRAPRRRQLQEQLNAIRSELARFEGEGPDSGDETASEY